MSNAKTPCRICGVAIQTWTAARTGGLCMPCSQGGRPVPEDFDRVRRRWGRKIVAFGGRREGHFVERYEAGDREAVWEELHRLDLRRRTSQRAFDDVVACVRLAMQRVRANVETLVQALPDLGYAFLQPATAHVPPTAEDREVLATLEDRYGPLPLTLRGFYEEVGSVDFRQDLGQLVSLADAARASASPLQTLGEHDPLYLVPAAQLLEEAERERPRLTRRSGDPPGSARLICWLAPDECHKANYSGGEDYQVYLPEPSVDFPLVGSWADGSDPVLDNEDQYPAREGFGASEFFISHLRACFLSAGFRGASVPDGEGPRRHPEWEPLRRAAAGLLPI